MTQNLPPEISKACIELGLARPGDVRTAQPLGGGVSCDIWRIDLADRSICAKRALAKLRVDANWSAPTRRIEKEAAFNQIMAELIPGSVPACLGLHKELGVLFSAFLDPENYQLWKDRLRDGRIVAHVASDVGKLLADMHQRSTNSLALKKQFQDRELFRTLRLDPYFAHTATAHPDLSGHLHGLFDLFETHAQCVTHGDFSPKNIMIGPEGPVILDAECANYGDPVFDVAFCLNHLLLKAAWRPRHAEGYAADFEAFLSGYLTRMDSAELIPRINAYLPALMLARLDGKSPVEYLISPEATSRVRAFARDWIKSNCPDPRSMARVWFSRIPEQDARSAS